jgi:putative addiction module component (TIGR02574 family)
MSTSLTELFHQARALPPEDRALLAEDLLASLHEEAETGAETAWNLEIERRGAEVKAGTAKLFAAEDVHAEARLIYR